MDDHLVIQKLKGKSKKDDMILYITRKRYIELDSNVISQTYSKTSLYDTKIVKE